MAIGVRNAATLAARKTNARKTNAAGVRIPQEVFFNLIYVDIDIMN
jgi:hypothetical protein